MFQNEVRDLAAGVAVPAAQRHLAKEVEMAGPAATPTLDHKPVEHWCEEPGCTEWGHHGRHRLGPSGLIERWFCDKHIPAGDST
jgi:hypothetical protein